ncbi:hypothetical protein [Orenia marismortui]|uniref:hypothetical protein n=1 Tax=Orenia marismortui TaxID=46469 RepID=UPI00036DADE2|nr:hypothetical protein [Orenia marismortui]
MQPLSKSINKLCSCGRRIEGDYELCAKCKSDRLYPDCDFYENKMMRRYEVPYCKFHDKQVLAIQPGTYHCKVCIKNKHNRRRSKDNADL